MAQKITQSRERIEGIGMDTEDWKCKSIERQTRQENYLRWETALNDHPVYKKGLDWKKEKPENVCL